MIDVKHADTLAERLFETERRIDDAVHGTADLLADLIEARVRAGLSPAVGADVQTRVADAVVALSQARRGVGAAHAGLDSLAKRYAVTLTGPVEKPEEDKKPGGVEQTRRAA